MEKSIAGTVEKSSDYGTTMRRIWLTIENPWNPSSDIPGQRMLDQ